MYAIKKIIGLVTQPGTIVLLLLSYGFLRLVFSRGSKKGWGWIGLGVVCFYLFTTAPLPNYLMEKLENRYEPVTARQTPSEIKHIVILSGGFRLHDTAPPTSQLDESSALRVAEGIRLFHVMSDSPILIMTGSGPRGDLGNRMVAFAQSLGVPPEKLIPENQAKDTYGNAIGIQAIVKNKPFLLVTSAAHMSRAMGIFQNLGMKPVPAPSDFRFAQYFLITDFFPSGNNLTVMEAAIHEYLGLAYLALFPGRTGK